MIRRIEAWLGGYFWMPCPACKEPFGGNEVDNYTQYIIKDNGREMVVCKSCSRLIQNYRLGFIVLPHRYG